MKKKILVTGANGFLGKNIIKEFSKNKDILLFALISKKKNKNKNKNITFIKGNLENFNFDHHENFDVIIHCAVKGVKKNEKKSEIFKTNYLDSTKFFLNAKKANIKNWLIIGSSMEYGLIDKGPISIKSILNPIDDYAKSKVEFYYELKRNKNFNNAKILYLRLFHLYGPFERKDRLYPSLLKSIKLNKKFKLTGSDEVRDFIHTQQAIKIIKKSLRYFEISNKPFFIVGHIATGKPTKVINFVNKIKKKFNSKIDLIIDKSNKNKIYKSMYSDKESII